jgi:hypothetical protein
MKITADQIKHAYELETDHDRPVTEPHQVPTSYKAMTSEWLTKVIGKGVPGAEVTAFRFDERDDGSSNRRRIFLSYNEAGLAAGLPDTVFCKAAETLQNRIVLGVSDTALAEANFYNLVRHRIDFEAPTPRFARFDPKSFAYLIMMDDIAGKVNLLDERDTLTRAQAEAMVTTLARFHSRFFRKPRTRHRNASVQAMA